MFYSAFVICLLINIISSQNPQCSFLNSKLNKYGIEINSSKKHFIGLRLCQGLINDSCCPQIYEDRIQNATATELYHLFELYSINLYEPLLRLTVQLNDTIMKLIELSRNETHSILQQNYKIYYNSYRSSIDLFYDNLYQYNIKNNTEELFSNILRLTIALNNPNKTLLPSDFLCIWRNHPFGNRPNLMINHLEINLGKLFHLYELFKLNIELIQVLSTSITSDYHCIDSYMQLSYCNLCSGRYELPCLSNCVNIIESCLVNVSMLNDIWIRFLDSIENVAYFNGIERVLSSIGRYISDALITFFNSDGIENKDIINQCGDVRIRKEILNNEQNFYKGQNATVSLLNKQLMTMSQSLEIYRSFWLLIPKQICRSDGYSASDRQPCWTGISVSHNGRQFIRSNYYKPFNLHIQSLLKRIKDKSQIIANIQPITTVQNISTIPTKSSLISELKLNLTENLDDYPTDSEFDYADYAYEDPIDDLSSSTIRTTSSTTLPSSTISIYDDISIDDINTVSYYDYAEQDVYSDDEIADTSTQQFYSSPPTTTKTTSIIRIPSYHKRKPIIWNINLDNDNNSKSQYNSSSSLNYSFLLLYILIFLFL